MNGLSKSEMELLASASSSTSTTSTSPDSPPNTLKFGHKIYFEHVGLQHLKSATGSSSSPPPVIGTPAPAMSKKGRGGGVVQGRQPARCQVEGCEADLSDVKAYYSRHKVCATHSKSPVVIVAGLEQRFCQQCSRFHRLPEFDQGKRSCRRRLAGHNERRRKPPPGSLLSNRYGSLSSSIFENNGRSGSFLVDFTAYPNLTGGAWPNTRSSDRGWDNQSTASGKLLQSHWLNSSENPTSDLVLQGSVARGANYSGHGIIPSGNCFSGISDSSGALSLLSNESWGSRNQSSSLGVNGLVNTDGGHTVQPSGSHAAPVNHYSGPLWGFKGNEASSSSHAIPPDLGLGHISQHAVNQYSGEPGMAQHSGRQYMGLEHSKGYDSSVQNVHWTL